MRMFINICIGNKWIKSIIRAYVGDRKLFLFFFPPSHYSLDSCFFFVVSAPKCRDIVLGARMCARPQEHTQKFARVDEISTRGKCLPYFASSVATPSWSSLWRQ